MSGSPVSARSSSISVFPPAMKTGRDELVAMLAQALGIQQATQLVTQAAQRVGVLDVHFTIDQRMAILDDLAGQKGTVGIVARFAKVRLILMKPCGKTG